MCVGVACATFVAPLRPAKAEQRPTSQTAPALPGGLIGYTEYRADLPGGMHPYFTSMRACVVRANGTGRRQVAEALTTKPHTWTQFAGWSPDGRKAIITCGWESPENAAWEEANQTFRMTEGWLVDAHLLDLASGEFTNLTAVERVSIYNTGLFFWPDDPGRLGFQALIGGNSHPFSMDRDGRNKKDLTAESREFAYGFSASPDGKRIAYHKSYKVFLADADGSNARLVDTGRPFNFVPTWSPDGKWVLFVSGEHYNCHPHVVRRDGTGLRKLADRGGYRGVVECIDHPAFHSASSDVPTWSPDGAWVYYTAKVGEGTELMRVTPNGRIEQLTHSVASTRNYHPRVSPDGKRMVFGSDASGVRQLYVMRVADRAVHAITQVAPGRAAMWAHWQPAPP